jgi:PAS domain S-box-containing protein
MGSALDERLRLENLYSYDILDTPEEVEFNELVRLAAIAFQVPMAAVTFIEETRQWFKAKIGMDACETARQDSFCTHTIQQDDVLVIPDATKDARVGKHGVVVSPPHIRFYAGAPLITPEGYRLGSLCVVDTKPRTATQEQIETLELLARQVIRQLEMRRILRRQQENIRRLGQMDQELFTSQRRFAAFMDNSPAIAFIKDQQSRLLYLNRCMEQRFDITLSQWYGKSNSEIFPLEYARELDANDKEVLERDQTVHTVERLPDVRGGVSYWLSYKFPLRDAAGSKLIGGIAFDISDQYRAEQALRESEELMRDILDNASDLIQSVAPDGSFIFVNRAWREKLGYREADVARLNIKDIVAPEYLEKYQETVQKIAQGQPIASVDSTFVARDGRLIPVEGAINCRTDGGAPVAFRSIFRDITERQAAEKMREDLISIASHEMRVPLTSIYGSLALLASGRTGQLPPNAARLVEIAHTSSERLVRLITDFLDLEKIKAGKMQAPVEPINLSHVLDRAIAEADGFADQFQVKFDRCNSTPESIPIIGNQDRLIQVVVNLLSNAAKFAPAGSEVLVEVRHTIFNAKPGIRVCVTDRGPGIPEEFRAKIFAQFSQAQSGKGGTGLGLSIAKAIVEAHDGVIGFITKTGQGTTFYFELPLAE